MMDDTESGSFEAFMRRLEGNLQVLAGPAGRKVDEVIGNDE